MRQVVLPLALALAVSAVAQESASYKLNEHTFNAGGNPSGGIELTSPDYKITLDAIGDSVAGRDLSSASFFVDGGFVASYPPPGEVLALSFPDPVTLTWIPERSTGDYNLYRDLMNNLLALGYGLCEQQEIEDNTTTVSDSHELNPGDGYFYLVTAENRLDEEGVKGSDSNGTVRQGSVCP